MYWNTQIGQIDQNQNDFTKEQYDNQNPFGPEEQIPSNYEEFQPQKDIINEQTEPQESEPQESEPAVLTKSKIQKISGGQSQNPLYESTWSQFQRKEAKEQNQQPIQENSEKQSDKFFDMPDTFTDQQQTQQTNGTLFPDQTQQILDQNAELIKNKIKPLQKKKDKIQKLNEDSQLKVNQSANLVQPEFQTPMESEGGSQKFNFDRNDFEKFEYVNPEVNRMEQSFNPSQFQKDQSVGKQEVQDSVVGSDKFFSPDYQKQKEKFDWGFAQDSKIEKVDTKEIENLKTELEIIKQELSNLSQQFQTVATSKQQLEQDKTVLEMTTIQLKDELKLAKFQSGATVEISQLAAQNSELVNENQRLKQDLMEMTKEIKKKYLDESIDQLIQTGSPQRQYSIYNSSPKKSVYSTIFQKKSIYGGQYYSQSKNLNNTTVSQIKTPTKQSHWLSKVMNGEFDQHPASNPSPQPTPTIFVQQAQIIDLVDVPDTIEKEDSRIQQYFNPFYQDVQNLFDENDQNQLNNFKYIAITQSGVLFENEKIQIACRIANKQWSLKKKQLEIILYYTNKSFMQFHDFQAICETKEGQKNNKILLQFQKEGPFSLAQDCDFTATIQSKQTHIQEIILQNEKLEVPQTFILHFSEKLINQTSSISHTLIRSNLPELCFKLPLPITLLTFLNFKFNSLQLFKQNYLEKKTNGIRISTEQLQLNNKFVINLIDFQRYFPQLLEYEGKHYKIMIGGINVFEQFEIWMKIKIKESSEGNNLFCFQLVADQSCKIIAEDLMDALKFCFV